MYKSYFKRILDYGKEKVRQGGVEFIDFETIFTANISGNYNLTCDTCGRGFTAAWNLLESTYKYLQSPGV